MTIRTKRTNRTDRTNMRTSTNGEKWESMGEYGKFERVWESMDGVKKIWLSVGKI